MSEIKVKDGYKTTKDLNELGQETVARHIAKCEGKDEKSSLVITDIRKRISKSKEV